ncbi:SRPBCC domain-containing protein [Christiangramia salexigens]|uniref:Activator of Hsp90 ATPase homologue 1/2-like C-terminal domain-containing protein n=1 Tax=Christiangramia salexigens TaxID=1913577 RepID=A0A1L3J435_9FLAO|nr:SRPBCC domain-containing protein [Christiangramia salexigens]APG59891.1 hypothetical protein LPB144_05450 [Christiangramia salexigens]
MKNSFRITQMFAADASKIYDAWLDSKEHSKMTGGEANCSAEPGGDFTAWDGYIEGTNKTLIKDRQIIQSWRTDDFQEDDQDSEIEINFREIEGGCELSLVHRNIPEGQPDYEQGWMEHYFKPMKDYFGAL